MWGAPRHRPRPGPARGGGRGGIWGDVKVPSPPWFLRCVSCPFWGLGAPQSISCGPSGSGSLFVGPMCLLPSGSLLCESYLSSEKAIFLWVQLFLTPFSQLGLLSYASRQRRGYPGHG